MLSFHQCRCTQPNLIFQFCCLSGLRFDSKIVHSALRIDDKRYKTHAKFLLILCHRMCDFQEFISCCQNVICGKCAQLQRLNDYVKELELDALRITWDAGNIIVRSSSELVMPKVQAAGGQVTTREVERSRESRVLLWLFLLVTLISLCRLLGVMTFSEIGGNCNSQVCFAVTVSVTQQRKVKSVSAIIIGDSKQGYRPERLQL